MPMYPSLPRMTNPVTRNEESLLLFLQRLRQSLEDGILQVSETVITDDELRQQEFVLVSLNPTVTPNGMILAVESGVLGLSEVGTDIVISVEAGGITYGKIQTVTADRILGREGTNGPVQELSLGSNLDLTSGVLDAIVPVGTDRLVDTTESRVILDRHSIVVSRYYLVLGTLTLLGDAALEIL